jgi:hypothetical protein
MAAGVLHFLHHRQAFERKDRWKRQSDKLSSGVRGSTYACEMNAWTGGAWRRLARGRTARPGDVPPQPCRRLHTPPSHSPCQASRQNPRRRPETQPASKIGKDWPVNALWGQLRCHRGGGFVRVGDNSPKRLVNTMPLIAGSLAGVRYHRSVRGRRSSVALLEYPRGSTAASRTDPARSL